MKTQNEDINNVDSDLVKDKDKTRPSEATDDQNGKRKLQKNQNHKIIFKDNLQDHNIGLILILTGLRTAYEKGA